MASIRLFCIKTLIEVCATIQTDFGFTDMGQSGPLLNVIFTIENTFKHICSFDAEFSDKSMITSFS